MRNEAMKEGREESRETRRPAMRCRAVSHTAQATASQLPSLVLLLFRHRILFQLAFRFNLTGTRLLQNTKY